jgi:tRNA isopentenyl-2-thiomethyl-A-37 hydroxylase MiaE
MRCVDVVLATRTNGEAKELKDRTSQIIFGERQHLLRVLDSLEKTAIPAERLRADREALERLIQARTEELNRLNPVWDEKISAVLSPDIAPDDLDRLARQAPKEDYYLLRLISEHPKASSKTLERLARHAYTAVRENVARHPNTGARTLASLSRDRHHPLWYLVAYNPNAPAALRRQLRARMRRLGEKPAGK